MRTISASNEIAIDIPAAPVSKGPGNLHAWQAIHIAIKGTTYVFPALFTIMWCQAWDWKYRPWPAPRTSSLDSSFRNSSAAFLASSGSFKSSLRYTSSPFPGVRPTDCNSWIAPAAALSDRHARYTFAPARARYRTVSRPIPLLKVNWKYQHGRRIALDARTYFPPVTMTTFPLRSIRSFEGSNSSFVPYIGHFLEVAAEQGW